MDMAESMTFVRDADDHCNWRGHWWRCASYSGGGGGVVVCGSFTTGMPANTNDYSSDLLFGGVGGGVGWGWEGRQDASTYEAQYGQQLAMC